MRRARERFFLSFFFSSLSLCSRLPFPNVMCVNHLYMQATRSPSHRCISYHDAYEYVNTPLCTEVCARRQRQRRQRNATTDDDKSAAHTRCTRFQTGPAGN